MRVILTVMNWGRVQRVSIWYMALTATVSLSYSILMYVGMNFTDQNLFSEYLNVFLSFLHFPNFILLPLFPFIFILYIVAHFKSRTQLNEKSAQDVISVLNEGSPSIPNKKFSVVRVVGLSFFAVACIAIAIALFLLGSLFFTEDEGGVYVFLAVILYIFPVIIISGVVSVFAFNKAK